ncbi:MAG: alanine racemase, partial [Clostridia bacterium]|nr:alanine racemase [Deltaproteobacteria bacterium]
GVDVASLTELEQALARGVIGARISVSGGAKSYSLLERAVAADVTIVCDSKAELVTLNALAVKMSAKVRIFFRFKAQPHSRFGLAEDELVRLGVGLDRNRIDLAGLAFHCTGYDVEERATRALACLPAISTLRAQGHDVRVLDIGGGFTVKYRDTADATPTAFHADHVLKPIYPYAAADGATMLDTLLKRISKPVRDMRLTLMIEPGRSLLDQAGITVTKVLGVRDHVTVDAMSFSLSEQWFSSEFFVDPVLIPRESRAGDGPWAGPIAGASCLESDMLAWRHVPFSSKPRPGDLLCFVNTAGYQMDSNESQFHGTPLPKKVVLHPLGARWCLDGIRPEGQS